MDRYRGVSPFDEPRVGMDNKAIRFAAQMEGKTSLQNRQNRLTFLLTIDVEDWFQVENFKRWIPHSNWSSFGLRVEENTHRILDLLDSISLKGIFRQKTEYHETEYKESPKATFFFLGWIAKRLPSLVREVRARGHEVASHGLDHRLCYDSRVDDLQRDISESKRLLEDIIGAPVFGYRAPSFSISPKVLKIIQASGYSYDSSFNSFNGNGRYGRIDLSSVPRKGGACQFDECFYELPISNLNWGGLTIPIGGGGYFRLMPTPVFLNLVSFYLSRANSFLFYFHPWELDPNQPRVKQSSLSSKFRHYYNIRKNESKLRKFLEHFSSSQFTTCNEYLHSQSIH